jgi:DNA-binding beta-propeller fold protein YncE
VNRSLSFGTALLAALLLPAASVTAGAEPPLPTLNVVATYDTGLAANGAEIISVRHTDGIAVLTNVAGSVDVLDLSDPTHPVRLRRVLVDTSAGTPNSAAVHPHHDYFLVVTGSAGVTGRVAAYSLAGDFLGSAPAGIQPDSVAISPNGQYAVVANEAEAPEEGNNGGSGSLTVVDLRTLQVTQVPLAAIAGVAGTSTGRTDDIGEIAIDHTPPTLEPESVAFSGNSRFAYVTLQENNAVLQLDMKTLGMNVIGVGTVSHLADTSTAGGYNPTATLTTFREPDGIAVDKTGRFFVTADEGDTKNSAGSGALRGGRTVSVFDASTGAFIADTGNQLDDAANLMGVYPDSRSNRGGSEPEVLDLTDHRGRTLVAVGLERGNAVALIDVTDPATPTVIAIAPTGVGPEGVKFMKRGSTLYVLSANEVSGTVTVLEVVD